MLEKYTKLKTTEMRNLMQKNLEVKVNIIREYFLNLNQQQNK